MENPEISADAGASFPEGGLALVIGAGGGIGAALTERLRGVGRFARVIALSRRADPALDITSQDSAAAAAARIAASGMPLRLAIIATGFLHGGGASPEKSWRDIDPAHMARAFAVNAIGPALLMKYFLPLLPRDGKSVFAALSARVGSIGDNRLGGWHSYRASKAALNQLIRTAAVELARTRPAAICAALHPGTVATSLSQPFARTGLEVQTPDAAAERLLAVIARLEPKDSGGFFDHRGASVPW